MNDDGNADPEDFASFRKRRRLSAASEYGFAHWMKPETQARLPKAREAFDNNRDPAIRLQKADTQLTEAQRRRRNMAGAPTQPKPRNSQMVKDGRPHPVLRPPAPLAMGADRAAFSRKWMEERMQAKQRARQDLVNDRDDLIGQRQKLRGLYSRVKEQDYHPDGAAMTELKREFFIEKRRTQNMFAQSQKHRQKFNRVMKRV